MTKPFYTQKLKESLTQKQRANQSYSLRAFARHLGLHHSTLSAVLQGKRPLPLKDSKRVMDKLNLSAGERSAFLSSLKKKKFLLDQIQFDQSEIKTKILDETYFQIIAEWEHYAVLSLLDCQDFSPTQDESARAIAKRLGLSDRRAEVVLENLLRYGLVAFDKKKKLAKSTPALRTSEDVVSPALRASHREVLQMGADKLDQVDVLLRDFSSSTLAIDLEQIDHFKTMIREFRDKIEEFAKTGKRNHVFQLGMQFYPLTSTDNPKEKSQ